MRSKAEESQCVDVAIQGLRVALVVNDCRIGGAERQALLLAGELARRGANPLLLGLTGDGPVMEEARTQGITADAVRLQYPLSPWYFFFNLVRAARLFRRHRPQVILGYTSVPNLYAGWLWKWAGARLFIWGQRDEGLDRPPPLMERLALRTARAFISNGPSGMDFLAQVCGAAPYRSVWVPSAVETLTFDGRVAARTSALKVLCVAHGRWPKDHETLLKAWREMQRRYPLREPGAHLVLAGRFEKGQAYADHICSLAAEPELASTVQFAGPVASVPPLLQDAGIGVLSSRSEGMPSAVLEYMAAGLPVVATDLPGVRSALGDEAAHWLVPPGDADALADRLHELIEQPSLREEWGRRHQARVLRLFSPRVLGDGVVAVIREAGGLSGEAGLAP